MAASASDTDDLFSKLSDDVVLKIFFKLEDDPRNWSRLAYISPKFSSLIRIVCWKSKCSQSIPSLVSDLLSESHSATGWASLHKLSVCCPGLVHSGVLLENSDFGLERELGPNENYREGKLFQSDQSQSSCTSSTTDCTSQVAASASSSIDCSWSMYDDLYFDIIYNPSKSQDQPEIQQDPKDKEEIVVAVKPARDFAISKRRKVSRSLRSHLASGVWNLSHEQGNKLLASRFRGDCLYICDWPGCIHIGVFILKRRGITCYLGGFSKISRNLGFGEQLMMGIGAKLILIVLIALAIRS